VFKILEDFKHFPQNKISERLYAEMENAILRNTTVLKKNSIFAKILKENYSNINFILRVLRLISEAVSVS